jgi:adenylate kinase family enzyme
MDHLASFFSSHDIILLGPPGSGKTTFVEEVGRVCPIRYISIGEITRQLIQLGDQAIERLLLEGDRWPLQTTTSLVKPYLDISDPFVLDGFPRYHSEARWLADYLLSRPHKRCIVVFSLGRSILLHRIRRRAGRPETTEAFIRRIDNFEEQIGGILDILEQSTKPKVIWLNGLLPPREVVRSLYTMLTEPRVPNESI